MKLHAEQRLLRLSRRQGGRRAHGLAHADVSRRVAAGHDGERDDEQRQADECPEADGQLGCDAQRRGLEDPAHAHDQKPKDVRYASRCRSRPSRIVISSKSTAAALSAASGLSCPVAASTRCRSSACQ